jgi:hypothetical protein
MRFLSIHDYALYIVSLVTVRGEGLETVLQRVHDQLVQMHRVHSFGSILKRAVYLLNQKKLHDTLILEIPTPELPHGIESSLRKALHVSDTVPITLIHTPELLGGYRASYQGVRIEGTLAHTRDQLHYHLTH